MKKSKNIVAILVIIISLLAAGKVYNSYVKDKATTIKYMAYVVEYQGQTLWDIAEFYAPGMDPRAAIHLIKKENKIGSIIKPGQNLIIPVTLNIEN